MRFALASALAMTVAFACGGGSGGGAGGSGVSSMALLVDLSPDQRADLCDFTVEVFGPEVLVTCDGDFMIIRGGEDFAECVDDLEALVAGAPECTLTVGEYETCARAVAAQTDEQLCLGNMPTECAPFAQGCFQEGGGGDDDGPA